MKHKVNAPARRPQPSNTVAGNPSQPAARKSSRATVQPYLIPSLLTLLTVPVLLAACTGLKPLKGGRALSAPTPSGIQQKLTQGDNASQSSRQEQQTIKVRSYTVPAGSRLEAPSSPAAFSFEGAGREARFGRALETSPRFVLATPMPVEEREESRARSELGAAQRDNARELSARLASLRGITWVGLAMFVFGLGTLVWPPLQALIGSVTTSVAIVLGGLALLILPTLIAGNELFILGGVAAIAGAWFLAHRHGHLRGQLAAQAAPAPGLPAPANDANPNRS